MVFVTQFVKARQLSSLTCLMTTKCDETLLLLLLLLSADLLLIWTSLVWVWSTIAQCVSL